MMNPLMESGTNRALQRARAFKSEYPCCTVVMHPSYIQANTLNLEAKFAREHLLNRTHDNVILRVSGGRTWPVKLHQYQNCTEIPDWLDDICARQWSGNR